MGLYLNPGKEAFERAANDIIYVDKTRLITYTNSVIGSSRGFICVSRPRRFGKSMTANMLLSYYDKSCDAKKLFEGYSIAKEKGFEEHLNKYDVIYLNIQQLLSGAREADNLVDYLQKVVLKELRQNYSEYADIGEERLSVTLSNIYEKDERVKNGFIFIVDEWDCLLREAQKNTAAQKDYLDLLKDLFKDRTYVKLVYMTGILPIKKYGTHSALNIFQEFTMTDADILAEYTGFTQREVETLCEKYQMDFNEIAYWYDGYLLAGKTHIYNPKSVVDVMFSKKCKSFWVNTETYAALKIYFDMNFQGLKDAILAMLAGEHYKINPRQFQNDMTTFASKDDVLTLLIHLGYLAYDEEAMEVFIPNEEIRNEFITTTQQTDWKEIINILEHSQQLLEATWVMDEQLVAELIDATHMELTSYLTYNNENALSNVITFAYLMARKDYIWFRELPTGKGFADIVFLPKQQSDKPAMIIELKWDKSAETAITQIKEKKYVKALSEYTGDVLLVGIGYDRKSKEHWCKIEKWQHR